MSVVAGTMLMGSVFAGCGDEGNADEIKVGANFERTGNVANYGQATLDGFNLAIKEINEAGGINGKKIKVVEADNKSEASEAVNAATKLISDDKVKVIVGPAVTANVIAESQVATDNKVPVIAPDATSPDVTVENGKVKPFIFRSCFIDPQQGSVMAKFAAEQLKAKTAVIYVDNSSDYSKSLGKVFKEKFEAAGGKVLMEEAFLAKDQDFKAALEKAKEARIKRAEIREELKNGKLTLKEVIDMKDDPVIGRMKVSTLIETLPGYGKAKSEKIMNELQIAESRRLRGLGERQQAALLERLG